MLEDVEEVAVTQDFEGLLTSITPLRFHGREGLYRFNYEHYHGGTKKESKSSDSPVRLSNMCDIVTCRACYSS